MLAASSIRSDTTVNSVTFRVASLRMDRLLEQLALGLISDLARLIASVLFEECSWIFIKESGSSDTVVIYLFLTIIHISFFPPTSGLIEHWKTEILRPWTAKFIGAEYGLQTMLILAAVLTRPFCRTGGETTTQLTLKSPCALILTVICHRKCWVFVRVPFYQYSFSILGINRNINV